MAALSVTKKMDREAKLRDERKLLHSQVNPTALREHRAHQNRTADRVLQRRQQVQERATRRLVAAQQRLALASLLHLRLGASAVALEGGYDIICGDGSGRCMEGVLCLSARLAEADHVRLDCSTEAVHERARRAGAGRAERSESVAERMQAQRERARENGRQLRAGETSPGAARARWALAKRATIENALVRKAPPAALVDPAPSRPPPPAAAAAPKAFSPSFGNFRDRNGVLIRASDTCVRSTVW